jgi:hypothetical protein
MSNTDWGSDRRAGAGGATGGLPGASGADSGVRRRADIRMRRNPATVDRVANLAGTTMAARAHCGASHRWLFSARGTQAAAGKERLR